MTICDMIKMHLHTSEVNVVPSNYHVIMPGYPKVFRYVYLAEG